MDITFENFSTDEFKITRIHGVSAFEELINAQNLLGGYQKLLQVSRDETFEDKYQNAGVTDSQIRSIQEQAFRHLSKAVILYQASMEAIVALAESHIEGLSSELKNKNINTFKKRWEKALEYFDESKIEFQLYEKDFYRELRIPLTHLVPKKEERMEQIKLLSYSKVYNGFRYGWWSYLRILRGLGLMNNDFDSNWKFMCQIGLNPEMFMDNHPDNIK